jgi:glucose-1-phosphate thymidylyltransferase
VKVIDPVYVEDGVTLKNSTIGPNVSLGAGAVVEGSTLADTIVGGASRVVGSTLSKSIIGEHAVVEHVRGQVNVSDHSVVKSDA